jgi:hypothetical protein
VVDSSISPDNGLPVDTKARLLTFWKGIPSPLSGSGSVLARWFVGFMAVVVLLSFTPSAPRYIPNVAMTIASLTGVAVSLFVLLFWVLIIFLMLAAVAWAKELLRRVREGW